MNERVAQVPALGNEARVGRFFIVCSERRPQLGLRDEQPAKPRQGVLVNDDVGVNEHEDVAGGSSGGTTAGDRRTTRTINDQEARSRFGGHLRRIVDGAVSRHDQVSKRQVPRQRAARDIHRRQAEAQLRSITMEGDDDGQAQWPDAIAAGWGHG
jgi:hypothetical protein